MFDDCLLVGIAGVIGANGDREFAHGRDLGGGGKGFNANIQLAVSAGRVRQNKSGIPWLRIVGIC